MGCSTSSAHFIRLESPDNSPTKSPKMFSSSSIAPTEDVVNAEDSNKTLSEKTSQVDEDGPEIETKKKTELTPEELKSAKEEQYNLLTKTADEMKEVNPRFESEGVFNVKIRNAVLRFQKSYFALKDKTSLENLVAYRHGVADIMMKTKFVELMADVAIYNCKNGWNDKDAKKCEKMYLSLVNAMLALLNFSDCSNLVANFLAIYPDFLEVIKQVLVENCEKYVSREIKVGSLVAC